MKVFVYSKKTNKNVAVIKGVIRVETFKDEIYFYTSNERLAFNTKEFKSTIYQN